MPCFLRINYVHSYMWVVSSSWIYCVNRFQLCIKIGNHPLRLSSAQLFHPLHLLQVIHRVDIPGPGCRLANRTSSAALVRGWVQLRDLWGDFWVTSFLLKVRRRSWSAFKIIFSWYCEIHEVFSHLSGSLGPEWILLSNETFYGNHQPMTNQWLATANSI